MIFTYTKRLLFMSFLLATASVNLKAQVTITPNQTATILAQTLAGDGVQVSNATLICPPNANGKFSKIISTLPLDSGIVLTTGQAQTGGSAIGVDAVESDFATTSNDAAGDPDLTTIANQTTNDACVLEFDFIPSGDTVKFRYTFASEEYNGPHGNFNCSINDVFGFFISGPGYTGLNNIALVPGTNVAVGVSTVNDGVGASPGNPCYTNTNNNGPYTQYYNSNTGNQTWVYTGYTDVFTALAAVTPCTTYHLKLAIADASDFVWDSGVFIEAGSLTSPSASIKPQFGGGLPYAVRNCYPGSFVFTRPFATASPMKVKFLIGGTAVNGTDYATIADSVIIPANQTSTTLTINGLPTPSPKGPVTVKLYVLATSCNVTQADIVDSAELVIYDEIELNLSNKDTTICAGQSVQLVASGDSSLTFLWSPAVGLSNPNIVNPVAIPDTTTSYTITASFPPSGCPSVSKAFTITVEPNPIVNISPNDTSFCLNDPYPILVDVQPAWFDKFIYSWSPTSDLSNPNIKDAEFFTKIPGDYKYTLTVTTPVGCVGTDTVLITARPAPELVNVSGDFTAKYGDVVQLNAEGATYYTWTPTRLLDYPTERNPKATAIDTVTFQVIGTDQYGCRDTAYVRMNVDYTMNQWIPTAFSPNGDGRNDVFTVKNMKFQRLIEFRIFNRWGQEIYSTTDPNMGWDGTYQGQPQEIGVYQYLIRVTTPDGKQKFYKGDVSLIR
jgi:gliding motility-associated-like protein